MPAEKAGDETPQEGSLRNQLGRMARTVKDYAPDWLGWAKGDAEASKPVPPGILETVLASVNIA